jgi:hypothetical protein
MNSSRRKSFPILPTSSRLTDKPPSVFMFYEHPCDHARESTLHSHNPVITSIIEENTKREISKCYHIISCNKIQILLYREITHIYCSVVYGLFDGTACI